MSMISRTIIEDGTKIKLYPDGNHCPTIMMEMQPNGSCRALEIDHYIDEFGNDVKTKDYVSL